MSINVYIEGKSEDLRCLKRRLKRRLLGIIESDTKLTEVCEGDIKISKDK